MNIKIKNITMKRLFISILMLGLAHVGVINAANTDISTLDNIIYVEPLSAEAGDQVVVSFKMKNSPTVKGFQFDLYLPDGVSVVASSQKLNAARKPDTDQSLSFSLQGDGAYRFLSGNMEYMSFKGTDGEVFTAIINIENTVAVGDHAIHLKAMTLSEGTKAGDKSYSTEDIETTLTITGISDGSVKLNENSTTLPISKNGATVKVTRTITAGNWSTICLPFEMETDQVTDAFGTGVQFYQIQKYAVEEDNITITFKKFTDWEDDVLEANTPYLIKTTKDVSEFTVSGVKLNPKEEDAEVSKSSGKFIFKGVLHAGTIIPADYLFLNKNKFYYSTGATTIKGFRGYFYIEDFSSSSAPNININIEGENVTNIEGLNIIDGEGRIYNLKGQHVENPTEKGVYIKNGKKVVIK